MVQVEICFQIDLPIDWSFRRQHQHYFQSVCDIAQNVGINLKETASPCLIQSKSQVHVLSFYEVCWWNCSSMQALKTKQSIKVSVVKSVSKQDALILITCSSKIVQWSETMLSKLPTFFYIHWVVHFFFKKVFCTWTVPLSVLHSQGVNFSGAIINLTLAVSAQHRKRIFEMMSEMKLMFEETTVFSVRLTFWNKNIRVKILYEI